MCTAAVCCRCVLRIKPLHSSDLVLPDIQSRALAPNLGINPEMKWASKSAGLTRGDFICALSASCTRLPQMRSPIATGCGLEEGTTIDDDANTRCLCRPAPSRFSPLFQRLHAPDAGLANAKGGSRMGNLRAYGIGPAPRIRRSRAILSSGGARSCCRTRYGRLQPQACPHGI